MIELNNNRLVSILRANDLKYYYATILFCKLAEKKWTIEKNKYTVKHGYVHIRNIIGLLDHILSSHTDDDILSIFDYDYLFILLSAAYIHDIGMQDYYYKVIKHITPETILDPEHHEEIRINHADIISETIDSIDSVESLEQLFGSDLLIVRNMIEEDNDHTTIDDIIHLILNKKKHIALVCEFHNKDLSLLPIRIKKHIFNNQLKLSSVNEEAKLLSVSALLQLIDTLDMSKSRITISEFIDRINYLYKEPYLNTYEPNVLRKMFLCYLIDNINIEHNNNNIDCRFVMSLNHHNLTQHNDFINNCRKKYSERLRRRDGDCIQLTENLILRKINLNIEADQIIINDLKPVIDKEFFKIHRTGIFETIDSLLYDSLSELDDNVFLYVKLYSELCRTFYGGIVIGDNIDKNVIEKLYFHADDWSLSISDGIDYQAVSILRNTKSRKTTVQYREYVDLCANNNIKSEIYYVIKFEDNLLGFINFHYDHELTYEEQIVKFDKINKACRTLGLAINNFHQEVAIKKYMQSLKSFDFIPDEYTCILNNLYRTQYYKIGRGINGIEPVKVSKIARLIKGSKAFIDNGDYNVQIHYGLLEWFVVNLFRSRLEAITDVEYFIVNDKYSSFIEIRLEITRIPELLPYNFIDEAYEYFSNFDIVPARHYSIKELQYMLPLKSFVILFGGTIIFKIIDDLRMDISIILPKKRT
jgi:hypothetical protein